MIVFLNKSDSSVVFSGSCLIVFHLVSSLGTRVLYLMFAFVFYFSQAQYISSEEFLALHAYSKFLFSFSFQKFRGLSDLGIPYAMHFFSTSSPFNISLVLVLSVSDVYYFFLMHHALIN